MGEAVRLENISVTFNGFRALTNVSMSVEEGDVRVIIGPNGAGKSTLMDIITGKTKPTEGKVFVNGQDITGKEPSVIAEKYHVGRKFQGPNIFSELSVRENIELAVKDSRSIHASFFESRAKKKAIAEKVDETLHMIQLYDKESLAASDLSHGERQWLEIGMVVAQDSKVIILDEPAAGLTDEETFKTGELIKSLKGRHTLLVVEHDMDFVRQISSIVTVLHMGEKIAEDTFDVVEKDKKVISVYLKTPEETEEEKAC
jgi:urea transport system ATP-binding protein